VTGGLSERGAVLTLYALAAVSGVVAIVTRGAGFYTGLVLVLTLALAMLILGVSLARIAVYKKAPGRRPSGMPVALPGSSYYRHAANAGINTVLLFVSYYAAYAFRFGSDGALSAPAFVQSLPVVFGAKMLALGLFGTYRSVWRYTDSRDLGLLVLASTAGSVLTVLVVLFTFEFTGYARAVFVLDWVLFTSLLAASRLSLRALSEMLRPGSPGGIRVLIYGAGDAGVSLLQELRRNPKHGRTVVGFLDDDPLKHRTRVQGLRVFSGLEGLWRSIRVSGAQEVIIAISDASDEQVARITSLCGDAGVPVSEFDISVSIAGVSARLDRVT
jgi:FlaA1/EpsC-like NDP-sugar epimerase